MEKSDQDLSLDEKSALIDIFNKIGDNIRVDLNERIKNLNNSILYKYYTNFFYFIPKHCFLEIAEGDHSGYHITPDQPFFVEDKKQKNTLKFTTKLETIIAPISNIRTEQKNGFLVITMNFNNDLEYDHFTLWIDPNFVKQNKFLSYFILKKILNCKPSDVSAEVIFKDNSNAIKPVKLSKLNYQFKPLEIDVISILSPHATCGFNINIDKLLKNNNEIKEMTLFLKINIGSHLNLDTTDLFRSNLIPIFNSYYDYSYSVNADMQLSDVRLRHDQNNNAVPISILSIYEDNKKIEFDEFFFKGQNEYYFNLFTQKLNYNTVLPKLASYSQDIRLYTYACWTDNVDLSDFIIVNSNDLSSIKSKITPIDIAKERSNYRLSLNKVFSLIEKLTSGNIFVESTIEDILHLLQVNENDITLLLELIENIKFDKLDNRLEIFTTVKYSKDHYFFLDYMMEIICAFINRNSSEFIKEFFLSEIRR